MEWLPNIITRRDEIFNLHLFKFPTTKDEVTRSNFITECLANLSNSKWQLLTTGSNNVFVIDENSLRSFGTEVGYRGSILHRTDVGLEHEIKVTGHGKSGLATTRRWNLSHFLLRYLCKVFECKGLNRLSLPITFFKQFFRLLLGSLYHILIIGLQDTYKANSRTTLFNSYRSAEQLIRPVPQFSLLTIHHGITKSIQMSRTLPRGRVMNDTTINPNDILTTLDKVPPEIILDILFKFRS
mmetsp:Transcript_23252/g.35247  ORF Transcript_23252/g.35247 Transcript_23252/m.35247 type:complete len:240 (+) Transcript_23252:255-974(+)